MGILPRRLPPRGTVTWTHNAIPETDSLASSFVRLWRSVLTKVIMASFQTVIKSARFVYSPYTATEMQGFAQVLADSIRARIQSGKKHLRPGGGTSEARTAGAAWLPRLQGGAWSPACP